MLAAVSPNVHDHDVGLPVDVSVNATVWPLIGSSGANVKAVAGAVPPGVVPPPPPLQQRRIRDVATSIVFIFFMVAVPGS